LNSARSKADVSDAGPGGQFAVKQTTGIITENLAAMAIDECVRFLVLKLNFYRKFGCLWAKFITYFTRFTLNQDDMY